MAKPRVLRAFQIVGACLLVLAGSLYLLRSALASTIAEGRLRDRGIECDDLHLEVSWDLSSVEIAPLTCRVTSERLESIALSEPATAVLSGLRLQRFDAPKLAIVLADDPGVSALPESLMAANGQREAPRALQRIVDRLAELSEKDLPELRLDRLEVRRVDRLVATFDDVRLRRDSELSFTVARVSFASRAPIEVTVRDVEGSASRSSVHIAGHLDVTVRAGSVSPGRSIAFRISGDDLDGEARYGVWTNLPAELGATLNRLRDRAGSRVDALRERIRSRRER